MGIMGMFKWLRKEHTADRNKDSASPPLDSLNNEAYRKALQEFLERRRSTGEPRYSVLPCSPDKKRLDFISKKNNNDKKIQKNDNYVISGVPHIQPSEIFEIGWVAGTEDRYLELVTAEWHNTRVLLKRHTHPDCLGSVMADIAVLTEIRHPNILLLMGTTESEEHGLVEICELVDCTLYNYLHDRGKRVSIQEMARWLGKIAEALRHALMRGYIHGALSSHCIYLTAGDGIKLGGWELATRKECAKADHSYDDRLRTEIFRWLAPEVFSGSQLSEATDIYGLALVIWEMSTMQVPWSNLSKSDLEKQYINRKQSVELESYDFPPLLHNILEKGLQVDVSNRTLDMNRMRRFLQCLEMQYENEEQMYVDMRENNNNTEKSITSVSPKTTKRHSYSETTKSRNIFGSVKSPNNRVITKSYAKKETQVERVNVCPVEESKQGKVPERKESFVLIKTPKGNKESNEKDGTFSTERSPIESEHGQGTETPLFETSADDELNLTETEISGGYESSDSCETTNSTRTIESSADESFSDTRNNIRKLKEDLAAKREQFFAESIGTTKANTMPIMENKFVSTEVNDYKFSDVRSINYKPYKPASHVVSLEPRLNKSVSEYDHSLLKPTNYHNRKTRYSTIPAEIKEAIIQHQTLNDSSQSFFESSWWRKEKMICESKMRKDFDRSEMSNSNNVSTGNINKEQEQQRKSPGSDETFTIDELEAQKIGNNLDENKTQKKVDKVVHSTTDNYISRSESLRALRDALDRATNIVQSTTPDAVNGLNNPMLTRTLNSPDLPESNTDIQETLFENLNKAKLGNDVVHEEIRSIEKNTNDGKSLLINDSNFKSNSETVEKINVKKYYSTNIDRTSNFVCESIPEHISEHDKSQEEVENIRPIFLQKKENSSMVECIDKKQESCNTCTACVTCTHKQGLTRRRSLPAALGTLKLTYPSSFIKVPVRKVPDVPDSTLEDIYIDDEFGDQLTVNMVLHDEVIIDEEADFLPDSMELLSYDHIHISELHKPPN